MSKIKYEYIMCRYGELSTKGKNRRSFTHQLLRNVKSQLKEFPDLTYKETYDRLYIHLNGEDGEAVSEELKHVFGLSSFSLAVKTERDMDEIAEIALDLIQAEEGQSFKVFTRRHDKTYENSSDTVNRHVASKILQNTDLKVDVHHPDISVIVEIRKSNTYIMMGKILGAQGYPVGIQGKVMLMLSGGIDSPVAAHLMMKRGVRLDFVHFASPPYTSDQALNKVLELAKELGKYQNDIRVHIVPFTKIQLEINKKVPESYSITMMRRFMLRIANELANQKNCLAIANGESLGQVASQTLESINSITAIEGLPVLRPLLTYDKIEIVDLAKKIGTYETSILPFDDCCTIFTPKNPVTKPKKDKIDRFESFFDLDTLMSDALENIKIIDFKYKDKEKEIDSFL